MHLLEDAQLSCDVCWGSHLSSRGCCVLSHAWKSCSSGAWLGCQGLEALADICWLAFGPHECGVFSLQSALCGLVAARSCLLTVGIFSLRYPLCPGLWVLLVGLKFKMKLGSAVEC